jgi:hypothetical protein
MKISREYLELNRKLHAEGNYGISGTLWARSVMQLAQFLDTRDILDYGCGQRTLEKSLGFPIHNYDPCIPGLDAPPQPAALVVCTDVLEHIEPDCLDDVLDDLQRVTSQRALLVIANHPATKTLSDGRNAHLIQEGSAWWIPRLEKRFAIHQAGGSEKQMIFVVRKLSAEDTREGLPR